MKQNFFKTPEQTKQQIEEEYKHWKCVFKTKHKQSTNLFYSKILKKNKGNANKENEMF